MTDRACLDAGPRVDGLVNARDEVHGLTIKLKNSILVGFCAHLDGLIAGETPGDEAGFGMITRHGAPGTVYEPSTVTQDVLGNCNVDALLR